MDSLRVSGRPAYGRRDFEREMVGFSTPLLTFALSLTRHRERAEDLVQDTYAKALIAWETYEPGTNMKAWLFTIARNALYSESRRTWRNVGLEQGFAERIPDTSSNQESHEEFMQDFCAIAPLLGFLPMEMRDSLVAVYFCGMKYEEASRVFDVEIGTVKSRVSRALIALRNALPERRRHPFDVSPWATASSDVPKDHPYFPVAKAYEEIYAMVMERPQMLPDRVNFVKKKEPNKLEDAWRELVASGALDDMVFLEE